MIENFRKFTDRTKTPTKAKISTKFSTWPYFDAGYDFFPNSKILPFSEIKFEMYQ